MSGTRRSRRRSAMGLLALVVVASGAAIGLGPAGAYTTGELTLARAACPSAKDCIVVGSLADPYSHAYSQVWNGKSWKVENVKEPAGTTSSALDAISCVGTKFCVAVGDYFVSSTESSLAEVWNGKSWKLLISPNPTGGTSVTLEAVSCISTASCVMAGDFYNVKAWYAWLTVWNGKTQKWTTTIEKAPKGDSQPSLDGISCTTKPSCMAVGTDIGPAPDSDSFGVSYNWNGKSWKFAASTPPTPIAGIAADSCTLSTWCEAVGSFGETWAGKNWKDATFPLPSGYDRVYLDAVACANLVSCMAVGESVTSSYDTAYVTEAWTKTGWKIEKVPEPTGGLTDNLFGLSCTSATACTAVGSYATEVSSAATEYVTVETWNGQSWKLEKPTAAVRALR
ncbi:MAG: hypothetical protein ACLQK4_08585 [Acidimicrobiales bacterium]